MTTTSSWPSFQEWQTDRALHAGDLDRFIKLRARWRTIRAYLLRRTMALITARMVAGFRTIGEAMGRALRQIADTVPPIAKTFADFARSLDLGT